MTFLGGEPGWMRDRSRKPAGARAAPCEFESHRLL